MDSNGVSRFHNTVMIIEFYVCFLIMGCYGHLGDSQKTYRNMVEIFRERNTVAYKIKHNLKILLYTFFLIRLSRMYIYPEALINHGSNVTDALKATILAMEGYHIEGNLFLNILLFVFALVTIIELFYYHTTVDILAWTMFEDVCIHIKESYERAKLPQREIDALVERKLNEKLKNHGADVGGMLRFWLRSQTRFETWYHFEGVDVEVFMEQKLKIYQDYCFEARREAVIVLQCFETLRFSWMMALYVLVAFLIPVGLTLIPTPPIFTLNNLLLCVDGCLFFAVVIDTLESGFLLMSSGLFTVVFFRGKLIQANRALARETQQRLGRRGSKRLQEVVEKFLRDIVSICLVLADLNESRWADMLFVTFIMHFFCNCYLATALVLQKMRMIKFLIAFQVMALQVVITTLTLLPQAHANKLFHESNKTLPTTQWLLKRNSKGKKQNIRLKIKVNEIYERLAGRSKYGLKMGPDTTVTYFWMFEIALCYVGYFLNFIDMLKKNYK